MYIPSQKQDLDHTASPQEDQSWSLLLHHSLNFSGPILMQSVSFSIFLSSFDSYELHSNSEYLLLQR